MGGPLLPAVCLSLPRGDRREDKDVSFRDGITLLDSSKKRACSMELQRQGCCCQQRNVDIRAEASMELHSEISGHL